ncbi:MAG: transcription elongation factor GreB [Deltaproteobacteria bacterium]|nr:transcription elongation factor GreB [Deltaproteobacteria bacterium]MBI3294597.1 transcription elongation factor GreB [Deltaproteobacteria bacterium]
MSKAFTKENDSDDDDSLEATEPAIPAGAKNYITPQGAERLRTEMKQLLDVERPKIVETVSWAARNGDRSENGDYIYGKRRLREIDRRIRFLTKRLEIAEVVNPLEVKSDRVKFGASVRIVDEKGTEKAYSIVGVDETNVKAGHISWISPLGRALLNARVGDTVTFRAPQGEVELEILAVEYRLI